MSLKRVLGPVDAGWLVAGNMIGAGIFFAPGQVAAHLPGIAWPLAAWGLGGLLALCGAAVYAELGSRIPRAGGDYQYLSEAFGPLWGFLTGWAGILLTFSAAAAVMSVVATDYLWTLLPPAARREWLTPAVAPLIVLVLTFANVEGSRIAGRATAWLTALPLAGLALLFLLGLLLGEAELHRPAASPPVPWKPVRALAAAMLPIFFTYSGWNAAAYLAGEVRDPARNLARGLLGGTVVVTLVYALINLVLVLVVPAHELAGSTTAAARAAHLLLGPTAEDVLALVIAVAVIGSANVTLMAGARIYYAMALDGLAPRPLGRINARGVPSTALWAAGIWTAILATIRAVEVLVNWATLAMLLLSSMAVLSLFVLRRRAGDHDGFRCPGYPVTPVLYLAASAAVIYASAVEYPRQSLYGILLVGSGLPAYLLVRRWLSPSND